jgi:fused signal recognition particle receptor
VTDEALPPDVAAAADAAVAEITSRPPTPPEATPDPMRGLAAELAQRRAANDPSLLVQETAPLDDAMPMRLIDPQGRIEPRDKQVRMDDAAAMLRQGRQAEANYRQQLAEQQAAQEAEQAAQAQAAAAVPEPLQPLIEQPLEDAGIVAERQRLAFEAQAAEARRQQYEAALAEQTVAFDTIVSSEFPDVKNDADLQRIAEQEPHRFARLQQLTSAYQRTAQARAYQAQLSQQHYQARAQQQIFEGARQFEREFADPTKQKAAIDAVAAYISPEERQHVSQFIMQNPAATRTALHSLYGLAHSRAIEAGRKALPQHRAPEGKRQPMLSDGSGGPVGVYQDRAQRAEAALRNAGRSERAALSAGAELLRARRGR